MEIKSLGSFFTYLTEQKTCDKATRTYECADFSLSLHNRIGNEITLSNSLRLNVTNFHLPSIELTMFQILNLMN